MPEEGGVNLYDLCTAYLSLVERSPALQARIEAERGGLLSPSRNGSSRGIAARSEEGEACHAKYDRTAHELCISGFSDRHHHDRRRHELTLGDHNDQTEAPRLRAGSSSADPKKAPQQAVHGENSTFLAQWVPHSEIEAYQADGWRQDEATLFTSHDQWSALMVKADG